MQPTDKVSLTYEQVQALGEVIKNNIGQARELTADDYDYPTGSPTSVAAWLLTPGLYTAAENVQIRSYAGSTMTTAAKKNFIVLNGPGASNKTIVDLADRDGLEMGITMYETSTSGSAVSSRLFLTRSDVIDNLTSTSSVYPLSANQGKILNDKIQPLVDYANYFISETNTGGTWIDGSAIYKKTVSTGALPNSSEKLIAHGITNIGRILHFEGYAFRSSDGKFINIPYASADLTHTVDVSVVGGNIRCYVDSDLSAFGESYITLYYTKSS